MAKIFGFTPDQVNNIGYERTLNLLHLDGEWRMKEHEEMNKRH
jgi:hypothetical protein